MKSINKNRFIQFELWKDCKIGCKFCYNRGQQDVNKLESLRFVLDKLDDSEVLDYNEIGFIGGEFFNDEMSNLEVKELFYKLFKKISKMHFEKIYFTTALIFNINNFLIPFLDYLKELKILDKCLLCTSYDIAYRFYTKEREDLWKNNMLKLHELYPDLLLHTEIIITQAFINAVLEDKFNISEFSRKYNTRVDYIEPSSGFYYKDKKDCAIEMPQFFPTKESFLKFLRKVSAKNEIELDSFLSMELRSSKVYLIDGGKRFAVDDRRSKEGRLKPQDSTKKYEIGFIDSEEKMSDIARDWGDLMS